MKTNGITGMEGAGNWRWPRLLSMIWVFPCSTENVWSCAKQVFMMMVLMKMGSILVMIFTSSTCVTLQTFHGCGSTSFGRIEALSRHLNDTTKQSMKIVSITDIFPSSWRSIKNYSSSSLNLVSTLNFNLIFIVLKVSVLSCFLGSFITFLVQDLESGFGTGWS